MRFPFRVSRAVCVETKGMFPFPSPPSRGAGPGRIRQGRLHVVQPHRAGLRETPRTCRRRSGTGLGRVNIGGHLTRWPNPSTRVFRFGRARLAPRRFTAAVAFGCARHHLGLAASRELPGAERGDTTPRRLATEVIADAASERKPGKGNEEIESFWLLAGACPGRFGTETSVRSPSEDGVSTTQQTPETWCALHDAPPRVRRAHRSSNSVASSTDAASCMPTAMHTPLQLLSLLPFPLPHLKASSESCRWEWSKHAEGPEDLRGLAVEQYRWTFPRG